MSTGRVEALSDGVFAIATTRLVLEIHVAAPGSGSLGHELLAQWPKARPITRKELATKRYGLRRSALLAAGVDEQTRELALGSATSAQV